MKYYQVLPQYHDRQTKPINGKWNGLCHIANELLTAREVEKYGYKMEYLKPVEVSQHSTYRFFGARFGTVKN